MIIGIDARFYGPKQKGLGRYVKELVDNLEKVDSDNRYFVFLRRENWDEYQPQNKNFTRVLADYPWYGWKEQVLFPFKIGRTRIDLMFFPHFNVPLLYLKPFVVVIHDLILKKFPTRRASTLGPVLYYFKNSIYHLVIKSAVQRARKVIAVSNCTKNDIVDYFNIRPEKIEVIYEGKPEAELSSEGQSAALLKKFNISKPYLLYVGNVYPHKNIGRLIRAFEILKQKEGMDLQLVLVGKFDYFYQRLQKTIQDISDIILTDYVDDQTLAVLYQNALLYVFPSLYEGFGLPSLEAMAHHLPVVCSNASCLPEILGQAALYFEPRNTKQMAQTIKLVLDDEFLQKQMIALGRERVKRYSWRKMAMQILKKLTN